MNKLRNWGDFLFDLAQQLAAILIYGILGTMAKVIWQQHSQGEYSIANLHYNCMETKNHAAASFSR